MRPALYDRLRCPQCRARLGLQIDDGTPDDVRGGWLDCLQCIARYPLVDGIPRFAPVNNYADSFGALWNTFRHALLDSALGTNHSRDRFLRMTGWTANELQGKWLLEIGCGSGRFTEVALACGANVVAVDYSSAIDVCQRNLSDHPRLHLVQADVYSLPFRPELFDGVYGFGVLHRTPDAHRALMALPSQLRDGGRLAVDIAPPRWFRRIGPTAWLRWFTTRMPPARAMALAQTLVMLLFPVQVALGKIPWIGRRLQRLLPIAPPDALDTCDSTALRDRARLAMCDRLTAPHHQPCRMTTLMQWLQEAGLENSSTMRDGLIVGRGVKSRVMKRESRAA
ncbi:MAG TPA: methyltransferase domain-containing protein [Planctomycetaceae bacterium]|nr:methyltransferase domain-containing protein [Planctomycetaceae bacterium]